MRWRSVIPATDGGPETTDFKDDAMGIGKGVFVRAIYNNPERWVGNHVKTPGAKQKFFLISRLLILRIHNGLEESTRMGLFLCFRFEITGQKHICHEYICPASLI
jgi:hypothetical protein